MKYFHKYGEGEMIQSGLNWKWDGRWFGLSLFVPTKRKEYFLRIRIRLGKSTFSGQRRLSANYGIRRLLQI